MRILSKNFVTETQTTVTASSIDSNFPVSNLKNPLRSKRVRTSLGTTTLTIVIDLQTAEGINSAVFLWPKEDGIRLTGLATVKIQANATNVWTTPAVDQTLTVDNDYSVASHFFTTDQSYRYWRVVITDATNPYTYIELGNLWLGKSLSIENAQNGFKWSLVDQSNTVRNEFGHKYTDEYPTSTTLEIQFAYLQYSEIQILENAYRTNGTRKPVLIALNPENTVYNKDHFLLYGTMSNSFGIGHAHYNLFNTDSIKIEELS